MTRVERERIAALAIRVAERQANLVARLMRENGKLKSEIERLNRMIGTAKRLGVL